MSIALMMTLWPSRSTSNSGHSNVIENLQVENRRHPNPTPPAIDIYPSTPVD